MVLLLSRKNISGADKGLNTENNFTRRQNENLIFFDVPCEFLPGERVKVRKPNLFP